MGIKPEVDAVDRADLVITLCGWRGFLRARPMSVGEERDDRAADNRCGDGGDGGDEPSSSQP
jgi:hypothetical protein